MNKKPIPRYEIYKYIPPDRHELVAEVNHAGQLSGRSISWTRCSRLKTEGMESSTTAGFASTLPKRSEDDYAVLDDWAMRLTFRKTGIAASWSTRQKITTAVTEWS